MIDDKKDRKTRSEKKRDYTAKWGVLGVNYFKGLILTILMALVGAPAFSEEASTPLTPPQFPFQVISTKDRLEFYPCSSCHEYIPANPTPRILEQAPHYTDVRHGITNMWCSTCHDLENKNTLRTVFGDQVNFDDSYLVCAQCHNRVYEDWQYGAHGKRKKRWRGGREIDTCTHCHNPHLDPGFAPRQPLPPPGVRKGMQQQKRIRHRQCKEWEACPHKQPEESHATE